MALLASIAGAVVVAFLLASGGDDGGARQAHARDTVGNDPSHPSGPDRAAVIRALERGVSRATALDGSVEAAVMLASWRELAVAASPHGEALRWMRMWSMSKVVTMVALLRSMGWGQRPGDPLSPEVQSALRAAITRSENCRQRRIVLELQLANGGSPQGAREAVAEVLAEAGASVQVSDEVEGPDPSCIEYLESQREIAEPLAPTVLLGTSTWRVGDAARFVNALGAGVYGRALADRVIALMRAAKAPSREVAPGELTAPLDWGAGRAFAGLSTAYKSGWGGTQQGAFLAGQIALVDLPAGERAAVAVMFHPDLQPPVDDPGRTAAPRALELVMESLTGVLR